MKREKGLALVELLAVINYSKGSDYIVVSCPNGGTLNSSTNMCIF